MFPNQGAANNGAPLGGTNPSAMDSSTQAQHDLNYNGLEQQQQSSQQQQAQPPTQRGTRRKPYVRIIEQPAGKALRFRYECEGRSAGSIPGVNSTPENKTYPTIEIVGYKGRAVVVVSCVTKDPPYKPHPHNLVGKEGCKKGVCTLEINSETMRAVFSNLGIQCVKKKDIEAALKAREEIRVDPFKTGFAHRFNPSSIDLNSVRLCFQVFMESEQRGRFTQPLAPVVSDPIYDKKAMSELAICRLCSCSASVMGNTQIILLCEKVAKEDIAVRFFEEENGHVVWEAYGEFQHTDVHKQTAITFKTPRYRDINITEPAKVFIQLKRPSDGVTSVPLEFEYVPLSSGRPKFWQLHRNLKRKPDLDLFQQILSVDGGGGLKTEDVIDLDTPTAEQCAPMVVAVEEEEAAKRRKEHEIDTIIDEKVRELEQQTQQTPLTADDKINEWMKTNELERLDATTSSKTETEPMNEQIQITVDPPLNDDDKALNELLEQVAELDEIYTDHVLKRSNLSGPFLEKENDDVMKELENMDTCVTDQSTLADGGQTSMDVDDNFDDTATYSSLQIAFKNPIPMTDVMPPTPPASQLAPEDCHYDPVEVKSHPSAAAKSDPILVFNSNSSPTTSAQSPPRPAPPKYNSPFMHVTAAVEEKVPPLPPKRLRKQDSNAENRSIEANLSPEHSPNGRKSVSPGPIIIMKTPDQSPPTKRLPPRPGHSSSTLPKQKKPGFFSKLFSRRKSKSELSEQNSNVNSRLGSKATSPEGSREPSIGHFNINDSNRASIRSAKSLQPTSLPCSPERGYNNPAKVSKPVGRSVSSVSGKRPAHLNADVIHIPLKGDSMNSLPQNEAYSNASTMTLGNTLDRKTVSALQLADIPICEGGMELVAIASRQSLRDLCQGEFNVQLDPNVDLTEAEHFALYTSIPPQATTSEFDETSAYYAPVDAGEILTPEEFARRLQAVSGGEGAQ